jgi:hypothetical protein
MVSDAGLSVVVIEAVNKDKGLDACKRVERRRLTNLRLQVSTLFPLAKLESEAGSVVLGWIEIPSHRSAPA